MDAFRIVAVIVGIVAYACYCITGSFKDGLPVVSSKDKERLLTNGDRSDSGEESTFNFAWNVTKEIMWEKDFIALVACNFIHQGRSVAHLNFASTATEVLISQEILPKGSMKLSLFFGLLTLGPQILLILNEKIVANYGAYRLMMISYILSACSACLYFFAANSYVVMVFMVIDSIAVHSVAPLFNIVFSDFIDDDVKRNARKSPVSSIVFSLNALFTKPSQSLAPIFAVYFLNEFGYKNYTAGKIITPDLVEGVRLLTFFTPLILASLQFLVLRPYTLGNRHLNRVNVL